LADRESNANTPYDMTPPVLPSPSKHDNGLLVDFKETLNNTAEMMLSKNTELVSSLLKSYIYVSNKETKHIVPFENRFGIDSSAQS
jgi:hypothetical protein